MSARAGIVVTGTEVLTGRIQDRNGPWLADRLLELGIDLAHVTICGDRSEDMQAQLRFMAGQGVDLVVTSGGLGPTADDLTMEIVARFCGRELVLDPALESRIAEILAPLNRRWRNLDPEAILASNRKQALTPSGAVPLQPVGTAPGAVVTPRDGLGPTVVVLPGPPRELHEMWQEAVGTEEFKWAMMAVNVQREVGGNLAELLDTLAATVREREAVRRQIRVLSAEGRLSMWLLTVIPPLLMLYIVKVNPSYMRLLWTTRIGWALIAVASILMTTGFLVARKMVRIDV